MTDPNPNNAVRLILLRFSKLGARLFRMNSGQGWIGRATKFTSETHIVAQAGDVLIRQARPFHAGFEGLSDSVGWIPVEITPDMVGRTVAVYAAAEIKTGTGRATEPQKQFIAAVRAAGGVAGVCRAEQDADAMVRQLWDYV